MVKNFKYIGRPTLLLAMATALIGIVFSFLVAWQFNTRERTFIARQFQNDVGEQVQTIERQLERDLETLHSFKMLFGGSEEVTAAEFRRAATGNLARHPALESIQWVKADGDRKGRFEPVYTHSRPSVASAPLNLSAGSEMHAVLENCRKSGTIDALQIARPPAWANGSPLYAAGVPVIRSSPAADRHPRDEPVGFILAIFRLDAIIEDVLNRTVADGINFTLRDGTEEAAILYHHRPEGSTVGKTSHEYRGRLSPFAGRQWHVRATPTAEYLEARSSIQPQVIFFAGAGLVAFATGLFIVLLRHSRIAEKMVEARTRELNRLNEKLEHLSQSDKLTGLANRRFFDEHFEREWKRALRSGASIALIMIDIDHFKLYNDFYGHLEGDKCLVSVARSLKKSLKRAGDMVARYGGEEFICVLPETGREGLSVAESLRDTVEKLRLPNPAAPASGGVLTVSVGFAFATPSEPDSNYELLEEVDRALYRAKQAGRNRVEMAEGSPLSNITENSGIFEGSNAV